MLGARLVVSGARLSGVGSQTGCVGSQTGGVGSEAEQCWEPHRACWEPDWGGVGSWGERVGSQTGAVLGAGESGVGGRGARVGSRGERVRRSSDTPSSAYFDQTTTRRRCVSGAEWTDTTTTPHYTGGDRTLECSLVHSTLLSHAAPRPATHTPLAHEQTCEDSHVLSGEAAKDLVRSVIHLISVSSILVLCTQNRKLAYAAGGLTTKRTPPAPSTSSCSIISCLCSDSGSTTAISRNEGLHVLPSA